MDATMSLGDRITAYWHAARLELLAKAAAERPTVATAAAQHPPTGDSDDVDDWPVEVDVGGEAVKP